MEKFSIEDKLQQLIDRSSTLQGFVADSTIMNFLPEIILLTNEAITLRNRAVPQKNHWVRRTALATWSYWSNRLISEAGIELEMPELRSK